MTPQAVLRHDPPSPGLVALVVVVGGARGDAAAGAASGAVPAPASAAAPQHAAAIKVIRHSPLAHGGMPAALEG